MRSSKSRSFRLVLASSSLKSLDAQASLFEMKFKAPFDEPLSWHSPLFVAYGFCLCIGGHQEIPKYLIIPLSELCKDGFQMRLAELTCYLPVRGMDLFLRYSWSSTGHKVECLSAYKEDVGISLETRSRKSE